jgi:serine/threonine protein kinase
VLLVSRGSETFALKILIKEFIVENRATAMVMAEKEAMAAFSGKGRRSHFITELLGTHQDAKNLYFILELLQGGELLALLDRKEYLPEGECAFYIACVAEAMEALHNRGWLFRDLKPDNILINARGYAKIADFGLAKPIGFDASNQITYTLCGTAQYMSPQVISGEGYGKDADWWAVGVVMFECLDGLTPFVDDEENDDPYQAQMSIFNNILSKRVQYQPTISSSARSLMDSLLDRNVSRRMAGLQEMRSHPYFRKNGIKWDKLEQLEQKAPWVPPVKDAFDISNSFQAQTEDEDTSLGDTLAGIDSTYAEDDWSVGF